MNCVEKCAYFWSEVKIIELSTKATKDAHEDTHSLSLDGLHENVYVIIDDGVFKTQLAYGSTGM